MDKMEVNRFFGERMEERFLVVPRLLLPNVQAVVVVWNEEQAVTTNTTTK